MNIKLNMINESPSARFDNIVVQELRDEILVCDVKSNRVFCLNQTAAEVWKLCDGKTETKQIAQILSKKLRTNVSEEVVLFSLAELSKENLLVNKITTNKVFEGISRREVVKRIGLSSIIALPLITSVALPTAAQAQSGVCLAINDPCASDTECCSGCCFFGNCGAGLPAGLPCTSGAQCCSGCCSGDEVFPGTCNPGC